MKKYIFLLFTISLLTLSACSNDKLTGTYTTTGHCPSHFDEDNIEFADGKVINNDNLESYEFVTDETVEFYTSDEQEAYVGTFNFIEEENGFTIDHNNGNYTCTFSR